MDGGQKWLGHLGTGSKPAGLRPGFSKPTMVAVFGANKDCETLGRHAQPIVKPLTMNPPGGAPPAVLKTYRCGAAWPRLVVGIVNVTTAVALFVGGVLSQRGPRPHCLSASKMGTAGRFRKYPGLTNWGPVLSAPGVDTMFRCRHLPTSWQRSSKYSTPGRNKKGADARPVSRSLPEASSVRPAT